MGGQVAHSPFVPTSKEAQIETTWQQDIFRHSWKIPGQLMEESVTAVPLLSSPMPSSMVLVPVMGGGRRAHMVIVTLQERLPMP